MIPKLENLDTFAVGVSVTFLILIAVVIGHPLWKRLYSYRKPILGVTLSVAAICGTAFGIFYAVDYGTRRTVAGIQARCDEMGEVTVVELHGELTSYGHSIWNLPLEARNGLRFDVKLYGLSFDRKFSKGDKVRLRCSSPTDSTVVIDE